MSSSASARPRATLTDYERRYCTASAQRALLIVRSLSDEGVLQAARDRDGVLFAALLVRIGADTNPNWLTSACATEAYERELIDDQELDWLTR